MLSVGQGVTSGVQGCNKGWVMGGESADMHVKESGSFMGKMGRMAGLGRAMKSEEDPLPCPSCGMRSSGRELWLAKKATGESESSGENPA